MSTAPSTLLRRPSAAAAVAPPPEPALVITGVLLEDAHSATEPATGRAAFTVVLAQPRGAPPIVATRWVGDGPEAAQYAYERAQALCAGDTVTVHGDGLRARYRHDTLSYVVAFVRDIELTTAREERP